MVGKGEKVHGGAYPSKAEIRKSMRRARNGPGLGYLLDSCTINPSENEALVRYALDKYKYLSLAPQHPKIGGAGLVGSCEFPDGYVEEWLRPGEENLVQRFDPSSPHYTIGFFIASLLSDLKIPDSYLRYG
ncbi:unnamed protein product [Trifolium pratense]|uniref:Uncharacterized protein n=1 Tax=Trifolium pratense TaxID=57577 RepID=A0ACB0LRN9_TRIPR|nr:unnamed protein product [Trifolium pratense]